MSSNLTRNEARERARLLSVRSYVVDLDLTGDDFTFRSVTNLRFDCVSPGASTFIEMTADAVSEIELNGSPVGLDAFDGNRIQLAGLAASNDLRVVADCAYSRSCEGLHRFTDPVDKGVYMYSDLETFDAHRIFACFDQPDLKATFELTVTGQDDWAVVSNMAPDGDPETAGPGCLRWHFPATPVISTYLTAVAAGPYHVVRQEHDGIPLGVFCRQSLASYLDPDEIFEVTRQGFDFYHAQFGVRYPFTKYDQLFVPEFKSGAMENVGCVTIREAYVFRSRVTDVLRESRGATMLHELAHMWFGDLVTMQWWDDLWLNESFATWCSAICQAEGTRWTDAWTTFAQDEKVWAYRQDQLSSTHPIAADIPDIAAVEVNFDGITYAKGAAVIKQLVAYVGRENFMAGVRRYFAAHVWGNATLADLLSALEESSGRDLSSWSKSWLETAGVNTLRPSSEVGPDGKFTAFSVLQEAPASHPELRSHRIRIGLYSRTDAGLDRIRSIEADIAGSSTEIPELIGVERPDLVLINDDDLSYAKIRFDEHSLRALIAARGRFTHTLPAALCWAATWDMVRDAELPTHDFLDLVQAGAEHITDVTVLQSLFRRAEMALVRYSDPGWRPTGLAAFGGVLRGMLSRAAPGSDLQLLFVVVLTHLATAAEDLDLLAGLLDGSVTIEGLTVDADLRWALLHRLVGQGRAGEAQIDSELDRDITDAGQRNAAAARAAIPTPEAKAEAWRQIAGGQLPGAMLRATVEGFQSFDQVELLAPYTEPFFEKVAELWAVSGTDQSQLFAQSAYPMTQVSQQTIDRADEFLATAQLPGALRRLLVEDRDDTARILRGRQCDAQATTTSAAR